MQTTARYCGFPKAESVLFVPPSQRLKMSTESFDRNGSQLLLDPMPITVAPPADVQSFAEILLSFRSCMARKAVPLGAASAAGKNESNGFSAAADGGSAEAAGEELRFEVPAPPPAASTPPLVPEDLPEASGAGLELSVVEQPNSCGGNEQTPAGGSSRKGRRRKTEEERDEFWKQAPTWLPEGWKWEVRQRKDGTRDRYYYDPETGSQFRSRKEIVKFRTTGELPKGKNKSKMKESNAMHTPSHSSSPSKGDNLVSNPPSSMNEGLSVPYVTNEDATGLDKKCSSTLEFLHGNLPGSTKDLNAASFEIKCGTKRNQQFEGGERINERCKTEGRIGIPQSVPSNIAWLGTIFDLETEKGTKSESEMKANNAKQLKRKKINHQSDSRNAAVGAQQSETERDIKGTKLSSPSSISGHEGSASRLKKRVLKPDHNILIQFAREICKKVRLASEACITNHSQNQ